MGIITNMRSRMQLVMWTILILFLASTAIVGVTEIFGGRQVNEVGSLNGKPILFEDYNQRVSNQINIMNQQSGRLISDEEIEYIRAREWERLIADLLIEEQIAEKKIVVSDEELLFQIKNNPPPALQNLDVFQSFGRFDLEKYLNTVLNPGQFDWKSIENYMINDYLPIYKLLQYITNAAAISSSDVLEDYKKRFLDYKIEVLHVTEKAIDQDFYKELLVDRPSDNELLDIYNENISDYDQPELRYLKYVKWPLISNQNDSLRVKLEAEDLIFRLNQGEDFALLANSRTQDPSNSADPQNLKGGNLGWFNRGQLLPEFEIASFEAEKGSIVGPILTQYGYHVIKVNDKRTVESNEQVNASHILLIIQPGRDTENELKDTANRFAFNATENGFFALADSLGLEVQDSNGLRKESIFIDNFGVGRSAVNFAFNNVEGSTSDAIRNDNFFGVFFLDKVDKEKVISFQDVKEDLKNEFLSEFKKNHIKTLAESIKDNNQGAMNLSEIYQDNENLEYVAETNSALIGSFESIGKSNFIVGALAEAKEGDILGPLPTLRGQAFLRVIDISDIVMSDFEEKKDSIKFSLLIDRQNAIWGNWLQALRDNADLKDYRYDFY